MGAVLTERGLVRAQALGRAEAEEAEREEEEERNRENHEAA